MGTKGRSALRQGLWRAQRLGKGPNPYWMSIILIDCVDLGVQPSTRRANTITQTPFLHTAIPSRRLPASKLAGSKAEIVRVLRLIH